jgi:two-component system chemotaxis response regulator CheB
MSFELVVVGAGPGALDAVRSFFAQLPRDLETPIVVVQQGEGRSSLLQNPGGLPLIEPEDKDRLRAGYVHIARPDYHLLLDDGHLALSTEPPVEGARPSISVLFESALERHGERLIGVLLGDTGCDGAQAAAHLARGGALLLVGAEGGARPAGVAEESAARCLSVEEIARLVARSVQGEAMPSPMPPEGSGSRGAPEEAAAPVSPSDAVGLGGTTRRRPRARRRRRPVHGWKRGTAARGTYHEA